MLYSNHHDLVTDLNLKIGKNPKPHAPVHPQAAFLDQGIVTAIAKLLTHLMRDETHGPEVTSLCTMALEIVTVLFNPDVCLNPLLPVTQRVIDDCPSVKEVCIPIHPFEIAAIVYIGMGSCI